MLRPRTPPLDPVAAAFLCQELIVDARLRHLARDRFEELQELSVLVFYFYIRKSRNSSLGERRGQQWRRTCGTLAQRSVSPLTWA